VIREVLSFVARQLPKRLITRGDGKPYLERYYLLGEPGGLKYFDEGNREQRRWQRLTSWLPCIYLHRFVASDDEEELHSHPWTATSIILAGGYREFRVEDPMLIKPVRIQAKTVLPWQANRLNPETYHRVLLLEEDCWSVILLGKKVQSWGFWSPATGEFLHWKAHLALRKQK